MKEGEAVTISVTGEQTERVFAGPFRVKTSLSYADRLARDQVRRELLGEQKGQPTPEAAEIAHMLSHLAVRVLDAPTWWTNATVNGVPGLGLEDDNVLVEVFNAVMQKDKRVAKALAEQAEAARQDLAKPDDAPAA